MKRKGRVKKSIGGSGTTAGITSHKTTQKASKLHCYTFCVIRNALAASNGKPTRPIFLVYLPHITRSLETALAGVGSTARQCQGSYLCDPKSIPMIVAAWSLLTGRWPGRKGLEMEGTRQPTLCHSNKNTMSKLGFSERRPWQTGKC